MSSSVTMPSTIVARLPLANITVQSPGWDPAASDCCDGCEDIARPLAGLGLPPGPWHYWTCKEWASFYGEDIIGICDPSRIQASWNCDEWCQHNPGFIKTRCPRTCGLPVCEGGEELPILGFFAGFLFMLTCCCGCKVHDAVPKEKHGPLLGTAFLLCSALVILFWTCLDPLAKQHGKKQTIEQFGGLGDLAGLMVGLLCFFILPELCRSCCRSCRRCCCPRQRVLAEQYSVSPAPEQAIRSAASPMLQPSAPTCEALSDPSLKPEDTTSASCVVCLERPKQVLIRPCKHICLCTVCSTVQVWHQCPICRESVATLEEVYL